MKKLFKLTLALLLLYGSGLSPILNTPTVYAAAGDIIDINGDFQETETGPWDPKHVSSNTYQDGTLWENDIKPSHWNFQMWPISANPDHFKAKLKARDGINFVEIDVTQKVININQAFLKRMSIPVKPNTSYELSALIELINISTGSLKIRIENAKPNKIDYTVGSGKKELSRYDYYFKTGTASTINLVVLMEGSATGSYAIGDVKLSEYGGEVKAITMDTTTIYLEKDNQQTLEASVLPSIANNKNISWSSSNPTIASVDNSGVVTADSTGETLISACSVSDPGVCAQRKVVVHDGTVLPEKIIINIEDTIEVGEKRVADYAVEPIFANKLAKATWSVSGDAIVLEDNQWFHAIKPGQSEITLTLEDDALTQPLIIKKTVQVVPDATEPDYIKIRDHWVKRIIGSETMWSNEHPAVIAYLQKLNNDSVADFTTMHKLNARQEDSQLPLWDNVAGETSAAHMTTQFRKLHTLTKAFTTKGMDLYQNPDVLSEIIAGFDYMLVVKKYGDKGSYSGNWWDWQIGSAQPFTESLLLLDQYLTKEQTERYATAIYRYVWDPSKQISGAYPGGSNATGANRGDIGLSTLAVGVLLEDPQLMNKITQHIPSIWKYVTSGDGFYRDGSFIQHGKIAYTGSYGVELIRSISALVAMTEGTQWELSSDSNFENLNTIIPQTYLPMVHQGQMMAMVMGRSISRAPGLNKYAPAFSGGAELSANLLTIESTLSPETSLLIRQHIKSWVNGAAPYYDYLANARDFEMLENLIKLETDTAIVPKINKYSHFFGLMARGLYRSDAFTAGLAFTNYRIANYEGGVGSGSENKKGWHTGDGMMYLYNNDLTMFGDAYWATVDYYRLPGITVDTRPLNDNVGQGKQSPNQRWVGGASDGKNIAMGFDFDKGKQNIASINLKAKKSYFFIDDQIIMLGSDINGTTPNTIETIIENRLLNQAATNNVTMNGSIISNMTTNVTTEDWVHLEGIDEQTSFGYVFLDNHNISATKTQRSGSYSQINGVFKTDDIYNGEYFLLNVNHGSTITDGKYAYIILPGKSASATANYTQKRPIQVLRQDIQAHAIYDQVNKVIMINVFDSSTPLILDNLLALGMGIDRLEISGGSGISLIISLNENNEIVYSIANPNMDGAKTKVTATMPEATLIHDDTTISNEVTPLANDNFELNFDSNGRPGTSWHVRYQQNLDLDALNALLTSLQESQYTKASWESFSQSQPFQDGLKIINQQLTKISQYEVNQVLAALQQTQGNLVAAGDFSKIDTITQRILAMKEQYTRYSWTFVQQEIEQIALLKDQRSAQDIVDTQLNLLQSAINNLQRVITFTSIDQWQQQHPIEKQLYTTESLNNYYEALAQYDQLIQQYDSDLPLTISQSMVDNAFEQLQQAYQQLQLINNELPETGVNNHFQTLYLLIILLASLVIITPIRSTLKKQD